MVTVGLIQNDRAMGRTGDGIGEEDLVPDVESDPYSYCYQQLKGHAVDAFIRSHRVLFPLRLDRLKALEDKDPTTRL